MKNTTDDLTITALEILRKNFLFTDVNEKSLTELGKSCRLKKVEEDQMIFIQGDISEQAYLVHSGIISIILESTSGRDIVINDMHPGDLFGELGVLTRQPRSASALARNNSVLMVIPRKAFLNILELEPGLARRILNMTAHRLRESSERESALAFLDAQARLARLLLQLEEQELEKGYITISQEEMARRTGQTRQTAAKFLGQWRRKGWLITGRGRIMLLNHDALSRIEQEWLN